MEDVKAVGATETCDWVAWPQANLYLEFALDGGELVSLHLPRRRPAYPQSGSDVARVLSIYLSGERADFRKVAVRFPDAPAFTKRAWEALREIPHGEAITYGELAYQAGNPRAARAAGHACATNPVAVVVPCHRVVAVGGLGGYGGDLDAKRSLLQLEGWLK